MMRLYNSKRYPDADTYIGDAAHEIDHHEFLKSVLGIGYSVDSAVSDMLSAMEMAAVQGGYVLLTVDINYDDSGLLYHMFDVDYKFTDPTLAAMNNGIQNDVVQHGLFVWNIPLIIAIMPILTAIIYYILANSFVKSLDTILYNPSDTGTFSTSNVIKYGIILIAAAYFLKAVTGTSQELRRY